LKRDVTALASSRYDVVVIGGGIFGACVAWEAASRGLSVALLERGDFSHATSSNSYKIAHGGMRYLQHADFARVRSSSHERSALYRVVPHLVHPVPILIPTYGHGARGKAFLRAGFGVYDALTWDRNRGISDPQRRTSRARQLSRGAALTEFPDLPSDDLTGGVVFQDGQMYSPPRIVLAFVRSAYQKGAAVANHIPVSGLLHEEGRVVGVEATDLVGGGRFKVFGKVVINAAGPWAGAILRESLGLSLGSREPSFSRDVGLVIGRQLHPWLGLAAQTSTKDAEATVDRGGRHLFILPWRDRTLVGVWHRSYRGSPDEIAVSDPELRDFVDDANRAYPGLRLHESEIALVITGLILFGEGAQEESRHVFAHRSLLVDHGAEDGLHGVMTVVGVRATVARGEAQRAVNRVAEILGKTIPDSRTASTPLVGARFGSFEELVGEVEEALPGSPPSVHRALAHNHGSAFREVVDLCRERPALAAPLPGSHVLGAEVVHAARRELAYTLQDVVLRRTDLGTAGHPGRRTLELTGELMADELGWEPERIRAEVNDLEAFYFMRGAQRSFGPAPSLYGREARTSP
jgi:glycerol-3-phosphate dehydrogenase